MRNIIFAAAAVAAFATPAYANEARVEARGGVIWADGDSEAFGGLAAGYDFDLGTSTFVGVEVSGDKVFTDNTKVAWGFTGRAGAKVGAGKLYAAGGYTTEFCDVCDGNWHIGAGYQHSLGTNLFGKLEYRRYLVDNFSDTNAVAVGVGMTF